MIKKIIATLTAIATILVALPLTAIISYGDMFEMSTAIAETYENLTYTISDGKITITDCDSATTELVIPSEIDGMPVICIGYAAFSDYKNLTSVVIPNSVWKISSYAFSGCTSLKNIELSDSLTCISIDAFAGCTSLESIELPDSLLYIADAAFMGCSGLTSITLPSSVKIEDNAFDYCTALETIYGYSGGTVEECANNNNITFISLGENTEPVEEESTEEEVIEDEEPTIEKKKYGDLTYYEYYGHIVILYCSEDATEVDIPSEIDDLPVTVISDHAFQNCSELTSVTIPDSVTYIRNYAFFECDKLTEITIPASSDLEGIVAYKCSNLKNIFVDENNENYCSVDGNLFNKDKTVIIEYCPGKEETSYTIPDTVTEISTEAFAYSENLITVDIPSSVTKIGKAAFNYSGITNIDIPNSVVEICAGAFDYTNLSSITIPESVESISVIAVGAENLTNIIVDENNKNYCSIDGNLFNKNKDLLIEYAPGKKDTEYTIPNTVDTIGSLAFSTYTENLKKVTIPSSVTTIEDKGFASCIGLESITIPNSVVYIGKYAFLNCQNLKIVVLSDSITEIGDSTFSLCYDLESVNIPDGITSIGESAFSFCQSLESIDIPDTVTEIGEYAFSSCSSLEEIVIPDSVTKINDDTFTLCSNLSSVTIPDSVTEIGVAAFSNCSDLEEITIPDSVTSIGDGALDLDTLKTIYGSEGSYIETYLSNSDSSVTFVDENSSLGDINNDNKIDAKDSVLILQYYAATLAKQSTTINQTLADINEDSKIDAKDSVLILRYYAATLAKIYTGSIKDFK